MQTLLVAAALAAVVGTAAGCLEQSGGSARTGAIVGTVRDEKKRPLEDARMLIVSTTATGEVPEILETTNARGHYHMNGLPPGWYTIRPALDGYTATPRRVLVRPGRQARADFAMKPARPEPGPVPRSPKRDGPEGETPGQEPRRP